jgi:hypothetical protein
LLLALSSIKQTTHRSVAMVSLAIDVKSSLLLAALILVSGVLVALPPLTESAGVDVDGDVLPAIPAFFFAAFSARRFCFEAEGAIGGERTID